VPPSPWSPGRGLTGPGARPAGIYGGQPDYSIAPGAHLVTRPAAGTGGLFRSLTGALAHRLAHGGYRRRRGSAGGWPAVAARAAGMGGSLPVEAKSHAADQPGVAEGEPSLSEAKLAEGPLGQIGRRMGH